MRREATDQRTAVYSFGDLAYDLPQGTPSEDTYACSADREDALPITNNRNPLAAVTMLLGAALGVVLLISALLGQSHMTVINDEAYALTTEIETLREEQTALRIRYETTLDLRHAEQYAADTLGMQQPGGDQIVYTEAAMPDKATVLHIRRGQGLAHLWGELVDTVGECFH